MIISTSKVKCYKECKRKFYFRYVEELSAVETAEALTIGSNYHEKIENLYNKGWFDIEATKESAMALAYEKYIYPKLSEVTPEISFEFKLNDKHTLVGRFDGITNNGMLVEHKTTSENIDDKYLYNLEFDEQLLNYMLVKGVDTAYYTVCKKPTIRIKKDESEEEFANRCYKWYDTETEDKIKLIHLTRNFKDIEAQKKRLIYIADKMEQDAEDFKVNKDLTYYRNTGCCRGYGRQCEFASICLDYNPSLEYVEFKKGRY